MGARILLAGATGLVGDAVLRKALTDPRVDQLIALVRRPIGIHDPKLVEWPALSGDLLAGLGAERVDAVICCLGTTIRKVGGDRQQFKQVDHDLVLGLARWAKEQGVPTFSVVSSIGADAGSRVFYNRVKGEMENGLRHIGLPRTFIFQPSILTGPRQEVRVGERLGIAVLSLLAPFIGAYRPMRSDVLAAALLESAVRKDLPQGAHLLRFGRIRALAEGRSFLSS